MGTSFLREKAHTPFPRMQHPAIRPAAMFHFRLSGGHGIGRLELLKLWSAACRSSDVAVSRVESGSVMGLAAHTYSLFGPVRNLDTRDVELRMREALARTLPKATIVLNRY
ncbi:MAG: hypothetical protein KGH92_06300 [Xanthomonadaceae bacterium]|nr:hypothetical protein [Xanthomonadaceae bacterium]MDE1961458.1 hypothetical protein [Xanthomonadaceae bacterium]